MRLSASKVDEGVWTDSIVQILAFEASLHKHHQEILADQDLFDTMFLELIRFASADDLRKWRKYCVSEATLTPSRI